jgi:hypothetical protein
MLKLIIAAAATLILASLALAQGDRLSKMVGGVTFYLGVIPAEIVRGHPIEHPESTMHGSPRKDSGSRHIVVALFDAKTGERITDAKVSARVEQLGLAADLKDLEPMQIAGTVSYGNFYAMPGEGIYRIRVIVKRRGASRPIEAKFDYRS